MIREVDLDTTNHSLVGVRGDTIVITTLGRELTKERAVNLAAWLVALADDKGEFDALLAAVKST